MKWKSEERNDAGWDQRTQTMAQFAYYEALNIIFRFENALRVFVFAVLKNEEKDKWKDCSFPTPSGEQASLRSIANKRIQQAESFAYLGLPSMLL